MSEKIRILLAVSILIICFSGCVSLNGNLPFEYQPSLLSSSHTIDKKVGMDLFQDGRPKDDVENTESIKDISEKITSKLIEDFEKSKLFEDLHFSQRVEDDLIIEGTVNRFMWEMHMTPIVYIPLVNFAVYFGATCIKSNGIADITLVVKDAKNGKALGTFQADSKVSESYTMYKMKAGAAGAELAEAFRTVAKDLKQQIAKIIK